MTDEPATHDVEVEAILDASAAWVFDAWLDPDLVRRWFGPGLGPTLTVVLDATVGGRFRIVQVRGGHEVGHSGAYLVLERQLTSPSPGPPTTIRVIASLTSTSRRRGGGRPCASCTRSRRAGERLRARSIAPGRRC